jgi:hypothetical protein
MTNEQLADIVERAVARVHTPDEGLQTIIRMAIMAAIIDVFQAQTADAQAETNQLFVERLTRQTKP